MPRRCPSPQAVFNRVVRVLADQGGPALVLKPLITDSCDPITCMYRGTGEVRGRRCAAGAWIPDDVYDPDMEGKSFITLVDEVPELFYLRDVKLLLRDLQIVHDTAYCTVDERPVWIKLWQWKGIAYMLDNCGERHELQTQIVEQKFPKQEGV